MSARYTDLIKSVDELGAASEVFSETYSQKIDELKLKQDEIRAGQASLQDRLEELESRAASPGKTGKARTAMDDIEKWVDVKSGAVVPVLSTKDRLSSIEPNTAGVSVGEYLRYAVCGAHAQDHKALREKLEAKQLATSPDSAGGFTLPKPLASEFIDLLRTQLVISQAGARTIPMETKTLALAKLATDVTAGWHQENASITPTDPTFGVVTLSSKTIVAVAKMSLEVSQDSLNIQDMLVRSLTGALAVSIDAAALANTTANGPSGILSFANRGVVSGVGSFSNYDPFLTGLEKLLAARVPLESVGGIVLGTGAYIALQKLKTGLSSDETTLVPPPVLNGKSFLPTVAVQTGSPQTSTAYMAMWSDLLWGIRKDITVRVLPEAFMASNLQIAVVCYARVDFQAAREQSFVSLEGISH